MLVHVSPQTHPPPYDKESATKNRKEKRDLVERDCAHGVLVYADDEPVGWCQYGPKEELPRMDYTKAYRKLATAEVQSRVWRITCFVVDRSHRKKGVATVGLRGALEAIRRRGGGVVEAYPIKRWGARADWYGTMSMFHREGFKVVAPFGEHNVLMRLTI